MSTVNNPNTQIYINIPRQDSVISLLNGYIELNFEVIKKTDGSRYVNGNDIRLVILGPIALFTNFNLSTSSGKHLEDISRAHLVSLMYKLLISSKDSDDLSISFDRSRNRRKDELAQNKRVKRKYHLKNMLKDVFGFAECQEKATYGLDQKLTLTRNKDEAVIDNSIANARIKIHQIDWCVTHYIPSLHQERILMNQIVNKIPTHLRYIERSVFMKEIFKINSKINSVLESINFIIFTLILKGEIFVLKILFKLSYHIISISISPLLFFVQVIVPITNWNIVIYISTHSKR